MANATFNIEAQVDTSQVDKLVAQLQAIGPAASAAATSLGHVTGGIKQATAATHEFSLANAGVVRELSVMFGEALRGNWTRLEGSLTVLANRTGLLAMAFSPLGAVIGGTVGVLGLFAVAATKGAEEEERLNVAMTMTGNIAGSSAGALIDMSKAAGEASGNISGAREAIAKLTEGGRFTQAQMLSIGTAAAEMGRVTGQNVDKIVSEFNKLADSPVKASLELNKQYHYLTAATYEQIAALERQGREEEAGALAAQTFADAMKKGGDQITENLGTLQRAAHATGQAFAWMWDQLMSIGRQATLDEQIKKAQEQVDALAKVAHPTARTQERLDAAKAQLTALQAALHDQQMASQRDSDKAFQNQKLVDAQVTWDKIIEQSKSKAQKEADEIAKIRRTGHDLGKSDSEIEAQVNAYKAAHPIRTRVDNGQSNSDIEVLRGQIEQQKQLREKATADLKVQLARRNITQDQFDQQLYQLQVKELDDDIKLAQQAEAIAQKKGKGHEAEVQYWRNLQQQFLTEKEVMYAEELAKENEHAASIRKVQEDVLKQADNFNRQQQLDYTKQRNALFMSPDEKANADARAAINAQYEKMIENETTRLQQLHVSNDQIKKDLEDLNAKRKEALDQQQADFAQRKADEQDWLVGARQAYAAYLEQAQNSAVTTKKLFSDAFTGMQDALMNFVTTGKLNFSSLAKSIITDIIKMEVQAAESKVLSYLGAAFGFGGIGGGVPPNPYLSASGSVWDRGVQMFAQGGVVSGPTYFNGGSGLMGEQGPEAIMPLARGADGRLGVQMHGTGANNQVVQFGDFHFTVNGNVQDKETAQAMQQQMIAQVATVVADQRIANSWRHNGISYNAART